MTGTSSRRSRISLALGVELLQELPVSLEDRAAGQATAVPVSREL
jgi:hypothetical protein